MLPTLLGLSMMLFLLVRLMPGDAALLIAFSGEDLILEGEVDQEVIDDMRAELGIDKPLPVQYVIWLGEVARLDFGESYWSRKKVTDELKRRLPITIELLILSVAVSVTTGLVVGVVSGVYQDTPIDYLGRLIGVLGLSLPNFWIALLVILLPALWWQYLPPLGYTSIFDDPRRNLEQFALPALTLGWSLSAGIMAAHEVRSSGGPTSGLCQNGPCQRLGRAHCDLQACAQEQPHPGSYGDWLADWLPHRRLGSDRERVRTARPRPAHTHGHKPARLPSHPNHSAIRRAGPPICEPDRRSKLWIPGSADPLRLGLA